MLRMIVNRMSPLNIRGCCQVCPLHYEPMNKGTASGLPIKLWTTEYKETASGPPITLWTTEYKGTMSGPPIKLWTMLPPDSCVVRDPGQHQLQSEERSTQGSHTGPKYKRSTIKSINNHYKMARWTKTHQV